MVVQKAAVMSERIRIRHASKFFGGIVALDDISLTGAAGQIVGIIGPNSSGKTSLLDVINGLHALDSGQIVFENRLLAAYSPAQRAALGITRSFKLPYLFPELSVREHLYLSRKRRLRLLWDSFAAPSAAHQARAEALLKDLRLLDFADKPARKLSLERQKCLELATVMMPEPLLILLDEISAGCANQTLEWFHVVIQRAKSEGATIFLVEHNLDMVRHLADWILVMNNGRLVAEGKPDEILTDKILLQAFFTV